MSMRINKQGYAVRFRQYDENDFWEDQAKKRGLSEDDAYDVRRDFGGDTRSAEENLEKGNSVKHKIK